MHFDALLAVVIARFVPELFQIEVRAQFPIDPLEEIQIEGGGHAENVIVCRQHAAQIFNEVRTEEDDVPGFQILPDHPEKTFGHRRLEISDGAAEKEHQHRCIRLSQPGCRSQPVNIRVLDRHNSQLRNVRQVALAANQRRAGEVDRTIGQRTEPGEMRQDPKSLFTRAAAEFHDHGDIADMVRQVGGMFREQSQVGASKAVFWQQGDRFEQRCSEVIVEILRIKFLLSLFCQARTHIGLEFRGRNGISWRSRQAGPYFFTHRNAA